MSRNTRNANCSTSTEETTEAQKTPQKRKKNKGGSRNGRNNRTNRSNRNNNSGDYGMNDVSWYAANEQLLKDAASLSFAQPVGVSVPFNLNTGDSAQRYSEILSIGYIPTFGPSESNTSPLNVSARRIYTFVRHANSGHTNYDAPDLMLYIMAMDSLYAAYFNCVRAYGIANVYSQKNRAIPDDLLHAIGFDGDDVRMNLANFRYHLNVIAAKLNSLAVPMDLPIFKRHVFMNSFVYLDAPVQKAQMYVFRPAGTWKFNNTASDKGGLLQYIPLIEDSYEGESRVGTIPTKTCAEWIQIINEMLDPIITDEDMNIMSGDILKAYGADKIYAVTSVSEDYVVVPTYQPEVLPQIQNLVYAGIPDQEYGGLVMKQNPDTVSLEFKPTFKPAQGFSPVLTKVPMTLPVDSPTPGDVMIASRLMLSNAETLPTTGGKQTIVYHNFGSEIVTTGILFASHEQFIADFVELRMNTSDATSQKDLSRLLNAIEGSSLLEKFGMHPRCSAHYFAMSGAGTKSGQLYYQDWDNVTTVADVELVQMHETALLSMFNVPTLAVGK